MMRRALSPTEAGRVDAALSKSGDKDEILVSVSGIPLRRHDARTLRSRGKLNDEVMNLYLELLNQRDERLVALRDETIAAHSRAVQSDGVSGGAGEPGAPLPVPPPRPPPPRLRRAYAFSTFFWVKLNENAAGGSAENTYTYANVSRWSHGVDIFACSVVIIPINVKHTHWSVGVIFPQRQGIAVVDSRGPGPQRVYDWLLRYVQDEHLDKRGVPLPEPESWQRLTLASPQQTNGVDCGVFSLLASDCLMLGEPLEYTQKDIPLARRWVALQCLEAMARWQ
jgi:sentrin-specific protease 1